MKKGSRKKIFSLVMAIAFVLTLFTGCGGDSKEKSSEQKEKKVVYALGGEPETLDPTLNVYSRSSIVLQNLFRGLYKLDESGKLVPHIAKECKVSDDGLKYTFKLDENAKWSDGKALTAHDFEYSWKRTLDPQVASGGANYLYCLKNGQNYNMGKASADEVGVKATDDYTLEIELENPIAYFIDLLGTTSFYPVRQDVVEGANPWTKSIDTYICNGPFMMKEIKPQEKYVLVKNPNYLNADNVKIDTLEIVFIESPESELAAYTNGEIDVSDNISNESMTKYKDTPDFNQVDRIGTYYFDINTSVKPFDDARVRKALSLAINRDQIINNIIQGTYRPAYGFVPYGIPYATEKGKNYREVVGDLFKEDIKEAQKLLAEAGYANGEGFPEVNFIILNSQTDKDIAQAIQSMWKENLGVNSAITTFESKVYWDELDNGDFHVARDGWTGDYPDPMTNLDLFFSFNASDDCRWVSEKYDALLNENLKITDQQKRMDNFKEAEQILMDEMPVIPLYYMNDSYLVHSRVKGVTKNYIGHTIFEYADVVE